MPTRLVGSFRHALDQKGRVILPAKFRTLFEHGGYLTQGQDGCLVLWTPEQFEEQLEERQARARLSSQERQVTRIWARNTVDVDIDRQGRLAIPAELRAYARLAGDVYVHGAIDRIELWDPGLWDQKVAPHEELLRDEALG